MDDLEAWIRQREDSLTGADADIVGRRLESEKALRSRFDGLDAIAEALGEEADASFEPFFSARVMARIARSERREAAEGMYDALRWIFPRLAAACLVVTVSIAAYSAFAGGYGGSVFDTVLGLPEATLATALAFGG